jgi:hypothetical protein
MILIGICTTLVLLFFFQIVRLFFSRFANRTSNEVIPYLRVENSEDLAGLLDSALERYLSLNLNHRQFRTEQLSRIRLCQECIGRRAHNARIWQEWADTELLRTRATGDEDVARAASELIRCCVEYRIAASAIQLQLYYWQLKLIVLPFAAVPRVSRVRKCDSFDLLTSYEAIKGAAVMLAEACGGNLSERLASVLLPGFQSSTVPEEM